MQQRVCVSMSSHVLPHPHPSGTQSLEVMWQITLPWLGVFLVVFTKHCTFGIQYVAFSNHIDALMAYNLYTDAYLSYTHWHPGPPNGLDVFLKIYHFIYAKNISEITLINTSSIAASRENLNTKVLSASLQQLCRSAFMTITKHIFEIILLSKFFFCDSFLVVIPEAFHRLCLTVTSVFLLPF